MMHVDVNTKKLKKNAFRVTKHRDIVASRVRVPGGACNADVLTQVAEIAREYGNGQVHITTRQGFEIEGISIRDMAKVNEKLQPIIENLEINQEVPGTGYASSGTRNVSACIGNRVCPFGNCNTAAFAKRIEKAIFPNDLHFKIALTGCANDCIKARMHDFGIIGMTEPQYDPSRCVSCSACIKGCCPEHRKMCRLRSLRYQMPYQGLDQKPEEILPPHHYGAYRKEKPKTGRRLSSLG